MAARIYRQTDADATALQGSTIGVLGYGNQGRAHALNLRDSGLSVVVGQRPGRGFEQAKADGFTPLPLGRVAAKANLLILTLPDECAAEIFEKDLACAVRSGQVLGFVHGFNIRFGWIKPSSDVDVIMVAPKGPGTLLRSLYVQGKGLPALLAVHQDATGKARRTALAWAAGIGSTRAGVLEATFQAETDADLFGEQAVLCGGISALTRTAFDTLVAAGYDPAVAYLECVHELKQIADLIYRYGPAGMRARISNTARYGDLTRGPRVISHAVREEMARLLEEIRDGRFAREWMEEHRSGGARLRALSQADAEDPFEQAGELARSLMPWLSREDSQ